ncbi:DUF1150 family protein [Halovulum sp. GXIMD14793]
MDYPSCKTKGGAPIAYVRSVRAEDLPEEFRQHMDGRSHAYSVHDASGDILAVVDDRKRAFTLARMNEFQPVSVH